MIFFIFTDIDGTLLDHVNYSYGNLKNYIHRIKNNASIIFNTSKTFEEIQILNNNLELNYPFIVENGACIFFPQDYLDCKDKDDNYFRYKNYIGYKLTSLNSLKIYNLIYKFKKEYDFSFYSELSDKEISKITNLTIKNAKTSKLRFFTNPIFWRDSKEKLRKFKSEANSYYKDLIIQEGGRFIHVSDNYDKALALKKFIKIIKPNLSNKFLTISLGDSENDICMLESTDYGCIVKRGRYKLPLKKQKNIFFSKSEAPNGWRESLDFVFKMENKNF